MADDETRRDLPPGLLSGLLFFAVVLVGSGYIVFSKLHDFSAFFVTVVPVLIMIGYALMLGFARLFRLRDDQSGDNLYYMGFLFTLTSLAVSLYQFSAAGSAEQIVQNFGIAIASTITGITLRILFNQMRRDPVEVEATSRLELAEASRRVKRELDSTVLEFAYFRRMTQQSVGDALDEMKETLGEARAQLTSEFKQFAATAGKPLEDVSRRSGESLDNLNVRIIETLQTVSERLAREGNALSRSTATIVLAIDSMATRLAALQTPDQIIEVKLGPMIQDLTRIIDSFNKSAETQAQVMEANLQQTLAVGAAVTRLIEDTRAADARSNEAKSIAPRSIAPKSGEAGSNEPKSPESKLPESKPLDSKPFDSKSLERKPTEPKSIEPKPIAPKPIDPKPIDPMSIGPISIEAKSIAPISIAASSPTRHDG